MKFSMLKCVFFDDDGKNIIIKNIWTYCLLRSSYDDALASRTFDLEGLLLTMQHEKSSLNNRKLIYSILEKMCVTKSSIHT